MTLLRTAALSLFVSACSGQVFSTANTSGEGGGTGAGGSGATSASTGGVSAAGTHSGGSRASGGTRSNGGTTEAGGVIGVSGEPIVDAAVLDAPSAIEGSLGSGDATTVVGSCPVVPPPDPASSCVEGLKCSYGTDPRPGCRGSYECIGGKWLASFARCTPVPLCTNESPPAVVGTVCNELGHFCQYSDQLTCGCVPCTDGNCPGPYVWNCAPPPPKPCPLVAPDQGQPCNSTDQTSCKYAFCPIPAYVTATCTFGVWQWDTTCGP